MVQTYGGTNLDLQEFNADMLYFEGASNPEVEELLNEAARDYGPHSERILLRALSLDESNLLTLIGLYRFYFYQGRYTEGLKIAGRVMSVVGKRVGFPGCWKDLTITSVSSALSHSFCMVRLYFFALKAAGYLQLRLLNFSEGREMIEKVVALDEADRIGARLLLDILDNNTADIVTFPMPKQEAK